MGWTSVGGSENSLSNYFDLRNAFPLFTLYPSHQSIYHKSYNIVYLENSPKKARALIG